MEPKGERDLVTKQLSGNALDTQIIHAISQAAGKDPLDVPPLYESVDLDALKTLVVDRDGEMHVEFQHAGCAVTVDEGTVVVEPED